MNRYFIELAYKGTHYHGWQMQPKEITVQELLNKNLSKVLREEISVVGAGRTDTGVHASFFVAHFDYSNAIDNRDALVYKLNCMLPKDIVVFRIYLVNDNYHARFDAVSRTYKYFVSIGKNPFNYENELNCGFQLDVDCMNDAAQVLFDYIDFSSFSKLHTQVKTNNCKIEDAFWKIEERQIVFTITADRFLRNMVRAIVGSMFELGRGKISINDFRKIIESKDRSKAGASAPPQALFLYDIQYPEEYGVINPYVHFG